MSNLIPIVRSSPPPIDDDDDGWDDSGDFGDFLSSGSAPMDIGNMRSSDVHLESGTVNDVGIGNNILTNKFMAVGQNGQNNICDRTKGVTTDVCIQDEEVDKVITSNYQEKKLLDNKYDNSSQIGNLQPIHDGCDSNYNHSRPVSITAGQHEIDGNFNNKGNLEEPSSDDSDNVACDIFAKSITTSLENGSPPLQTAEACSDITSQGNKLMSTDSTTDNTESSSMDSCNEMGSHEEHEESPEPLSFKPSSFTEEEGSYFENQDLDERFGDFYEEKYTNNIAKGREENIEKIEVVKNEDQSSVMSGSSESGDLSKQKNSNDNHIRSSANGNGNCDKKTTLSLDSQKSDICDSSFQSGTSNTFHSLHTVSDDTDLGICAIDSVNTSNDGEPLCTNSEISRDDSAKQSDFTEQLCSSEPTDYSNIIDKENTGLTIASVTDNSIIGNNQELLSNEEQPISVRNDTGQVTETEFSNENDHCNLVSSIGISEQIEFDSSHLGDNVLIENKVVDSDSSSTQDNGDLNTEVSNTDKGISLQSQAVQVEKAPDEKQTSGEINSQGEKQVDDEGEEDDDDDDDDFGAFEDIRSSVNDDDHFAKDEDPGDEFGGFAAFGDTSSLEPASEGGGWAAFGDQNKEDNEMQNDNWAAFSEASPTGDKVEDIQENIDTDADDSFGEFGESSTLKSMDIQDEDNKDDFGVFSSHVDVQNPEFVSKSPSEVSTPETKELNVDNALAQCFPQHLDENANIQQFIETDLLEISSREIGVQKEVVTEIPGSRFRETKKSYITVDMNIWNNIKFMENTQGLKFQWANSNASQMVLKAINIDTRNMLLGHKKPSVPIFASGLGGLLEPKTSGSRNEITLSATLPSTSPAANLQNSRQSIIDTSKTRAPPSGNLDKDVPPVDFDWTGSGLTNPLDAHSTIHLDLDFFVKNESYNILSTSEAQKKEQAILQALEPTQEKQAKTIQPLENILANMKFTSTLSTSIQSEATMKKLGVQANDVVMQLPDFSFMQARVLMFPVKPNSVEVAQFERSNFSLPSSNSIEPSKEEEIIEMF